MNILSHADRDALGHVERLLFPVSLDAIQSRCSVNILHFLGARNDQISIDFDLLTERTSVHLRADKLINFGQ